MVFLFRVAGMVSAAIERNAVEMSPKQQQQKHTTSIIETLEGRQLFSAAAPALDAGADAALAAGAGKVSMQDFHFVMTANKASPKLMADAGKVSMQDFHFVMKVNKASPELSAVAGDVRDVGDAGDESPAGISIVAKPTKHTPGLTKVRFNDIPIYARQDAGSEDLSASAGKVSMQDFHLGRQGEQGIAGVMRRAQAGVRVVDAGWRKTLTPTRFREYRIRDEANGNIVRARRDGGDDEEGDRE